MKMENFYAAYIDKNGVAKIQTLEKELGNTIIAYSTPPQPAKLPGDKLSKIKKLEEGLCVRLVAYETN
jgi:hypothetical protein